MICQPCAAAADNRLARDFHCNDAGCTCGHRTDRYGTTITGQAVNTGGGETT